MRLWSLHPAYLDSRGLVALWREALLAKHVLEGRTKGYTNHPQLTRFKALEDPVSGINQYLSEVHAESVRRGYRFDPAKIGNCQKKCRIPVTSGQIEFEKAHLLKKLQQRDPHYYQLFLKVKEIKQFGLFTVVEGEVAPWEKLSRP